MDTQARAAHPHPHSHHHAADPAAGPDKPFTDPVCGMKVAADPAKKIAHAGRDYFFCSPGCMAKFSASPQSFSGKLARNAEVIFRAGDFVTRRLEGTSNRGSPP